MPNRPEAFSEECVRLIGSNESTGRLCVKAGSKMGLRKGFNYNSAGSNPTKTISRDELNYARCPIRCIGLTSLIVAPCVMQANLYV